MNKRQEDKLSMYEAVLAFNQQNNKVSEPILALQNAYTALNAVVAAIHSTVQLKASPITGHAIGKADKKNQLSSFGNDVAGIIFAWAANVEDKVTMEKAKTSYTKLHVLRDEQLADTCRNYYQMAADNQTVLAEYGLTIGVLNAFKQAIDSYQSVAPAPRNATVERKTTNSKLVTLFNEADGILKNKIDKLCRPLGKTNADYYDKYTANRRIVSSGSNSTALRITVKDAATGQTVTGAGILIEELKFEAATDKEGQATAKPVPLGTYTAIVKKEGYQPQTIGELKATLGKTNKVEVLLKKAG
jgi:Carboxypeptidase regulatory-like domain